MSKKESEISVAVYHDRLVCVMEPCDCDFPSCKMVMVSDVAMADIWEPWLLHVDFLSQPSPVAAELMAMARNRGQ